MIEYKVYDMKEFNNFNEDIKWDIYSELVKVYREKVKENERQYNLLRNKQDIIINLKEILHEIIESIGDDK